MEETIPTNPRSVIKLLVRVAERTGSPDVRRKTIVEIQRRMKIYLEFCNDPEDHGNECYESFCMHDVNEANRRLYALTNGIKKKVLTVDRRPPIMVDDCSPYHYEPDSPSTYRTELHH